MAVKRHLIMQGYVQQTEKPITWQEGQAQLEKLKEQGRLAQIVKAAGGWLVFAQPVPSSSVTGTVVPAPATVSLPQSQGQPQVAARRQTTSIASITTSVTTTTSTTTTLLVSGSFAGSLAQAFNQANQAARAGVAPGVEAALPGLPPALRAFVAGQIIPEKR